MNVEYMTHSGDDLLIVNAARVSFSKESDWEYDYPRDELFNYKKLSDRDRKLLNFLAREKHLLPYRHPQITLRCKAPLFLARQLGKHQVGFSWSEESRRYISDEPQFYWPDKWRKKAENVKQGSSDEDLTGSYVKDAAYTVEEAAERAAGAGYSAYMDMMNSGVAPELARMILPQNMYINWVWTGSLLGWYQMYAQRSESTAQKEARDFAALVKEVIQPLYPAAWAALKEHCTWD